MGFLLHLVPDCKMAVFLHDLESLHWRNYSNCIDIMLNANVPLAIFHCIWVQALTSLPQDK